MSGSVFWRAARSCYVYKYVAKDGGWAQKYVPREFTKKEKRAALAWAEQWAKNADALGVEPARKVDGITLRAASDRWLELAATDERTSPASLRSYRTDLRSQILNETGLEPSERIAGESMHALATDYARIKAWYLAVRKRAPSVYRARDVYSTLRMFFDEAIIQKWMRGANPLRNAALTRLLPPLPTKREAPIVYVPIEHAQQLINDVRVPIQRRIRYLLAFTSGEREGELSGLTWSHVHLDAPIPTIEVERAYRLVKGEDEELGPLKTHTSARTLPLHPATAAALRWWRDDPEGVTFLLGRPRTGEDPVFPAVQPGIHGSDFARPRSADHIRIDLKALGLATTGAKGKNVTMHSCRKSFLTFLERAGVPEGQRKTLAGHGISDVTDRYYTDGTLATLQAAVASIPLTWDRMEQPGGANGGASLGASGTKDESGLLATSGHDSESRSYRRDSSAVEQRFRKSRERGASGSEERPKTRKDTRSDGADNASIASNALAKEPGKSHSGSQTAGTMGLSRVGVVLADGTRISVGVDDPSERALDVLRRLALAAQLRGHDVRVELGALRGSAS